MQRLNRLTQFHQSYAEAASERAWPQSATIGSDALRSARVLPITIAIAERPDPADAAASTTVAAAKPREAEVGS
jgi:hypothetical protein